MTLRKTCPRIGPEQHVPKSPFDEMEIAAGSSNYLVRLVFLPYTQVSRTIGTSVAQRQIKHSSPSLGQEDLCSLTQRISQYHGDRQTKKTDRDRHTDEQRYIKTHRQTRVRTGRRQDFVCLFIRFGFICFFSVFVYLFFVYLFLLFVRLFFVCLFFFVRLFFLFVCLFF